jgi:hypothetical protein
LTFVVLFQYSSESLLYEHIMQSFGSWPAPRG